MLHSCLTDIFLVITMVIGIKPVTNHNEFHLCSNRLNKGQLAHSPPNFYVYNCLVKYVRGSDDDDCSPIQCVRHSDFRLLYMKHTSNTALSTCCFSSAGPSSQRCYIIRKRVIHF